MEYNTKRKRKNRQMTKLLMINDYLISQICYFYRYQMFPYIFFWAIFICVFCISYFTSSLSFWAKWWWSFNHSDSYGVSLAPVYSIYIISLLFLETRSASDIDFKWNFFYNYLIWSRAPFAWPDKSLSTISSLLYWDLKASNISLFVFYMSD